MKKEASETLAISAFQYLAGDPEELARFMAVSGLNPEYLRSLISEREFLVAILDHFLGHEPTLLAFAASQDLNPEDVRKARFDLSPPGPSESW